MEEEDMEEKEAEAEVTKVSGTVFNLIEVLRQAHRENGEREYYYVTKNPKGRGRRPEPITPVTDFVFELFIYNSIYQVDWHESLKKRRVVDHKETNQQRELGDALKPYVREGLVKWNASLTELGVVNQLWDGFAETQQQDQFENFLNQYVRKGLTEKEQQQQLENFLNQYVQKEPALLYEAFNPIRKYASLEGDWTEVKPDKHNKRITEKKGKDFFECLRRLHAILLEKKEPEALPVDDLFGYIAKCRNYVYLVRNNIFHGSKPLPETEEQNQKQRIALYLAFVRSLNQLFFAVCDKFTIGA